MRSLRIIKKINFLPLFAVSLIAALLLTGCSEDNNNGGNASPPSSGKEIMSFKFETAHNISLDGDVTGIVSEDNAINIAVPFETDATSLVATFETTGKYVTVNGLVQESGVTANDYNSDVDYTVEAEDGTTAVYTVTVTVQGPVPEAPGPADIMPGDCKLSLSWDPVEGADSYEVWYGTSDNTGESVQSGGNILNTYYTITGLANGTLYYVWLKARNKNGASRFSEASSMKAQVPSVAPDPPSTTAIVAGDTQIKVYWAPPDRAEEYEIWSSRLSVFESRKLTADNVAGTSYTITGLTNGYNYYVWIRAKNFWGIGDFSEMLTGSPKVTAIPAAPSAPEIVGGDRKLGVFWNAVENADCYEVWYGTSDDPGNAIQIGGNIDDTAYSITGLTNGATYYVWIRAKNEKGAGDFSVSSNGAPAVVLTFDTAASPGNKVSITIGSELAVMIYANSSTEDIVFPMGTDDSSTGTISRRFFMSETEMTFAQVAEVFQWAYDNGRLSDDPEAHNSVNFRSVRWGMAELSAFKKGATFLSKIGFFDGEFIVDPGYEEYPASHISWYGAIMICNWLTEMRDGNADNVVYSGIGTEWPLPTEITQDLSKTGYRLPTSEEWEFAARWAGTTSGTRTDLVSLSDNNPNSLALTGGFYWTPGDYASGATADYINVNDTNAVSWNKNNSNDTTHAIGSMLSNSLGIYDMSGNIEEMTSSIVNNDNYISKGGKFSDSVQYLQAGYVYMNYIKVSVSPNNHWGFHLCRSK